eukprot:10341551-Lingulodinium_polyedra.AAC.2
MLRAVLICSAALRKDSSLGCASPGGRGVAPRLGAWLSSSSSLTSCSRRYAHSPASALATRSLAALRRASPSGRGPAPCAEGSAPGLDAAG